MLLRDNVSCATLVASDWFDSEEKVTARMWTLHRTRENAEGAGFTKDRSMSSPRGGCRLHCWNGWAAAACVGP